MPDKRLLRWSLPIVVMSLVALAATAAGAGKGGQVTVQGRLDVAHQDTFAHAGAVHVYTLDTGTERLTLSFPDGGPHELAGAVVRVTGIREGKRVSVTSSGSPHVEEMRTAAAPGGGGKSGGGAVTPVAGDRDTLVIMFNFADNPGYQDLTPEHMRGSMFTDADSVAQYYNQISFGDVTFTGKDDGLAGDHDGLTGDVAGWFTLSQTSTNCSYSSWASAAKSAATAAGWNLTGYEHIVHYFPLVTSCNWRGLGELGGSNTWINGSAPIFGDQPLEDLIAHELGHNLTLHHAQGYSCSSGGVQVALSNSCSTLAYQDPFDIMGRAYRHLNTFNTAHLGWIGGANILAVPGGGTFTLEPLELPSTGAQVLRLDLGKQKGRTNYMYVEYRQPVGFDAGLTDTGALLRIAPAITTNSQTLLIDGDPTTSAFSDATLLVGHGFVDPTRNIYVKAVSATPGGLTVLVQRNRTNASPQAQAGSGDPLTVGAEHTHIGASATDADANLGSYAWAWSSCPSTCPSLTGATGSLARGPSGSSAQVPGPTFTPGSPGTYRLTLTLWDTAGASTSAILEETAA